MFKSWLRGLPGSGMIFLSSCDLNNNIIWIRERNYPTGFLCKKNYPTISLIPPWDELSFVVFRGNFCHGEAEICYASLASLRSARSAHLDKASRQAILEKLSAVECCSYLCVFLFFYCNFIVFLCQDGPR